MTEFEEFYKEQLKKRNVGKVAATRNTANHFNISRETAEFLLIDTKFPHELENLYKRKYNELIAIKRRLEDYYGQGE